MRKHKKNTVYRDKEHSSDTDVGIIKEFNYK